MRLHTPARGSCSQHAPKSFNLSFGSGSNCDFPQKPPATSQRTLGRGFVQPGNVKNAGAGPTYFKLTPVSQRPQLSRPRVLYIPCFVRHTFSQTSFDSEHDIELSRNSE
jgi:hypothetical protein